MDWTRPPAVAGMFYPDREDLLRSNVEDLLGEASRAEVSPSSGPPKAIIAPHAGYIYSGPVAASAYRRLHGHGDSISRVILLGPGHRYPVRGLAASSAEAFLTPLGLVPLDREGLQAALALDQVALVDEAHEGEHSLEVHLPFLQVVLGDFSIIPLVVGEASPEEVAETLGVLWGGPETLVVISSDLSHFLTYAQAAELDASTAQSIAALRPEEIRYDQACGRLPVGGLLLRAREEGLSVECVDLRNSGDTAGARDQVVGYGSWVFG
ncbi:MAG: AmmeMemoRadiSam system protein B [Gemmatimonadetes bacterium]|nr:AmmeMemoRadiSam system protein B [Gemmatimonadota bacterium]